MSQNLRFDTNLSSFKMENNILEKLLFASVMFIVVTLTLIVIREILKSAPNKFIKTAFIKTGFKSKESPYIIPIDAKQLPKCPVLDNSEKGCIRNRTPKNETKDAQKAFKINSHTTVNIFAAAEKIPDDRINIFQLV